MGLVVVASVVVFVDVVSDTTGDVEVVVVRISTGVSVKSTGIIVTVSLLAADISVVVVVVAAVDRVRLGLKVVLVGFVGLVGLVGFEAFVVCGTSVVVSVSFSVG